MGNRTGWLAHGIWEGVRVQNGVRIWDKGIKSKASALSHRCHPGPRAGMQSGRCYGCLEDNPNASSFNRCISRRASCGEVLRCRSGSRIALRLCGMTAWGNRRRCALPRRLPGPRAGIQSGKCYGCLEDNPNASSFNRSVSGRALCGEVLRCRSGSRIALRLCGMTAWGNRRRCALPQRLPGPRAGIQSSKF